VIPNGI